MSKLILITINYWDITEFKKGNHMKVKTTRKVKATFLKLRVTQFLAK